MDIKSMTYAKWMRAALSVSLSVAFVYVVALSGLYSWATIVAFLIIVALVVFGNAAIDRWVDNRILDAYANQIDNIYEYSRHPGDRLVYKRAQQHRALLKKADNQNAVQVHEIIFQEGVWVNETWEEYQERLDFYIKGDRASRHDTLLKKDREKYLKYISMQEID